jgi:hypothetical protein
VRDGTQGTFKGLSFLVVAFSDDDDDEGKYETIVLLSFPFLHLDRARPLPRSAERLRSGRRNDSSIGVSATHILSFRSIARPTIRRWTSCHLPFRHNLAGFGRYDDDRLMMAMAMTMKRAISSDALARWIDRARTPESTVRRLFASGFSSDTTCEGRWPDFGDGQGGRVRSKVRTWATNHQRRGYIDSRRHSNDMLVVHVLVLLMTKSHFSLDLDPIDADEQPLLDPNPRSTT